MVAEGDMEGREEMKAGRPPSTDEPSYDPSAPPYPFSYSLDSCATNLAAPVPPPLPRLKLPPPVANRLPLLPNVVPPTPPAESAPPPPRRAT